MSGFGYLERLLGGAAVEWVPLGELAELVRGSGLPKSDFTETGIPAIHYGQIYTHYGMSTTTTKSFVAPETAATLKKVNYGDIVITNTSENFEDVATPLVYFGREQAVTGGHATIIKPGNSLSAMYFAHFTQTPEFEDEKRRYAKGTKVIDVSAVDMAKILVPIPCRENPQKSLAIQAEIVRILGAFTALSAELTAKLTAELTARKTQFSHYRNQLFSFDGTDVQWRTLGDSRVGAFTRGGGLQKKDLTDHGVPCIHYGQIYTYYGTYAEQTKSYVTADFASKARKAKPGDLVIATTSENDEDVCKAVAWLGAEDVVVSSDACFFAHHLNPKYVSYFFQTEQFQEQKKARITGTKVRRVNADDLAKILIPIPFPDDPAKSLAEQERIAKILNKFDTITASLSEGLHREIALRQKQYEYYRNLLLSFPKGGKA